ncbi:NAD(P)/FAD-dependent oxidoreductase [Streptosporangium sp. 'caverna']|uniref:FAD-dependent oxidoreductase n=1 Tax=Streptosporangium sp. 'caverna' TaxID=2202249 RepID=UPI000D7DA303|nr:NAD(P)/FAD-dependent oxidoreductase [Streptosporangium sp. 'caverna']AWS42829.1 hypothetical protein DKM19_17120 [Streptosporangium sp. 'caverna']
MPTAQALTQLEIVILGAGPAGLATARLLHLNGVRARVFEKDADRLARTQGGSLDLGEDNGLRTLAAAGLMGEFEKAVRPQGQHTNYFGTDGALLLSTDESDEDEIRPEIDRLELRSLLLDSLPHGTVEWGREITSVEVTENRWRVGFEGGDTIEADLVIGADGVNSRTRPTITDEVPAYIGVTFIAGEISHPSPGSYAAEIVGEGAGLCSGTTGHSCASATATARSASTSPSAATRTRTASPGPCSGIPASSAANWTASSRNGLPECAASSTRWTPGSSGGPSTPFPHGSTGGSTPA